MVVTGFIIIGMKLLIFLGRASVIDVLATSYLCPSHETKPEPDRMGRQGNMEEFLRTAQMPSQCTGTPGVLLHGERCRPRGAEASSPMHHLRASYVRHTSFVVCTGNSGRNVLLGYSVQVDQSLHTKTVGNWSPLRIS